MRHYIEGDALYADLREDIAAARSTIRMEFYIFADDEAGGPILDLLARAAARGIGVRLRIDPVGSWGMLSSTRLAALRAAGVELQWSRPWSWRRPWSFHRRNHRKLLIVDDTAAYLGGFNIHRDSSAAAVGPGRWRDTHLRFQGELVQDAIRHFDAYPRAPWPPATHSGRTLVPNSNWRCRHVLHCEFTDAFRAARHRIWLTTPYFVPDRSSQAALRDAARRGLDVRLLVPGKSDVPITQWAAHAAYASLRAAGVRIWEYQPRVLHAKTILVDDDWATVGTANFDYRSFFVNDELNLFEHGPSLNGQLAGQFVRDLREAAEVTPDWLQRRPWHSPFTQLIGWWARRWL
jgi:cardiolipin synthase